MLNTKHTKLTKCTKSTKLTKSTKSTKLTKLTKYAIPNVQLPTPQINQIRYAKFPTA
jgi:hypothetical protein